MGCTATPSHRQVGGLTAYCFLPTAYCLLPTAYCLLSFVVRQSRVGAGNPQLSHFVEERRAFKSQPLSSASGTAKHPLGLAQGPYNLITFYLGKGVRPSLDFPAGLPQF